MAIYYLGMKSFGRSQGHRGSRATSGAAYRAGERIRDERTGIVYDHRSRRDVLHKEIVLPSRITLAGRSIDWARDRSSLWNAAELAERNKNARVAREFTVALPHELSAEQRVALARRFAQEISDRYGNAVDLAIHAPRGDPRNFHAHLFATTREVTAEGLGPKTTLELSGTERHRRGLTRWAQELASIRERWAGLANESLKEAHVEARIAALSRTEVLSRASPRRLPLAAYHIERRGERSFVAERLREKHRAVLARAAGTLVDQLQARTQAAWAALRARLQELRSAASPERQIASPEHVRDGAVRAQPEAAEAAHEARQREAIRNWLAAREMRLRGDRGLSVEGPDREGTRYPRPGRAIGAEPSREAPEPESVRARTRSHDLDMGL